uniref:Anaphase-promoting complex subunit CDC26 n=1 Tax=Arion vulgaris TaxID=1028688 RepID=A0A0B7ANG9_9EUPU
MLRRKPTRIELKMSDLEEYETVKKEREAAAKTSKVDLNLTPEMFTAKNRMEIIHARIGYDPKPLPQPSTLPH